MLINTTDDLRLIEPRIHASYEWELLSPFVEDAELKHVIPIIGQEFYDELVALTAPNAEQESALKLLRKAVGRFAMVEGFSLMGIQIGQAGVATGRSNDTLPMAQWKEIKLLDEFAAKGETALDAALLFLETNSGSFTTWESSAEYSVSKELFINNALELSNWLPLFNSRRAYLALRNFIKQVEREVIKPTLGAALFADLKAKVIVNTLTDGEKELIEYIRKPLANLAAASGFPQLSFSYNGKGFRLLSDNDSIIQKMGIPDEKLSGLITDFTTKANTGLAELKRYLQDNADTFTLYKESTSYVPESSTKPYEIPNNAGRKSFMV